MRMRLFLTALSVILIFSGASAAVVDLGNDVDGVAVTVEESNDMSTIVRFEVGSFNQEPVTINNEQYYNVSIDKEAILLNKGEPQLPQLCRSIIIPDNARMEVKVIDAKYTEFANTPIAPSKGSITRNINPDDVPFAFGNVYAVDAMYPQQLSTLRDPYILRDFRGVTIEVNAFQYNPVTRVLRVYTEITVEVTNTGPGSINVKHRNKDNSMVKEFQRIYQHHFINYDYMADKYTPVDEEGDLLIITYDSFHDAMLPLVSWKMQKGIKTTLVDLSTIGNTTTAIKNYIQAYYDDPENDLAFVLLVGDGPQITSYTVEGGASDPSYVLLEGTDSYPEAFIGRFSAENVSQVETQVERTITYEQTPVGSAWFHKGTGIASSQGAGQGHNGEADYVHMGLIRDDLLAFDYTEVDELYETNGATASQVSSALNTGRGIINYCGHGSTTAWSTTGFSNTNVNALTNDNMLPFIISVACVNGNYVSYTCFGEAWLRATHNGAPTGAIGAYMSSVNQDWVPPMHAQDEAVDLLVGRSFDSYGGLCFNGSCKMIDLSGTRGEVMFKTWHIFGDPSVQVRTDDPVAATVNHDDVVLFGLSDFQIEVVGVEDALCALYANGTIYGTGYTGADGIATIPLPGDLPIGENMTITVTGFNIQTYTASIPVVAPNGPYLVYDYADVDDYSGGNGNGMVDFAESIVLGMQLKNVGPDGAVDVNSTLSSADSYVTITDATEAFGDITGDNGTSYVSDAFAFDVSPIVPDGYIIPFTVTSTDVNDSTWSSNFSLTAHAPTVGFIKVDVDDTQGDGNSNGIFDPGETVEISVSINNSGSGQADNVAATLATGDSFVFIDDPSGTFGNLLPNTTIDNKSDVFVATADGATPLGYEVGFELQITADGGYTTTLNFTLIIGDRVPFFSDDFAFDQGWTGMGGLGEWTIGPCTGGTGADSYGGPDPSTDHSPTADNQVLGNDLTSGTGGDYGGLGSTYWVTSPMIDCADFNGCILSFYRWLGVEKNTYDHAYLQVNDGSGWVTIYQNGSTDLDDQAWVYQEFDISEYADYNSTFQLRFGIGPTDGSYHYCGWNIDDLTIKGYGEYTTGTIAFDVEELCDSLVPGDTSVVNFRIYNLNTDGTLRVRFSSSDPWVSCPDSQHYIAPLDSMDCGIMLNSDGMNPGDYTGNLFYMSNDLLHQYDTIPVMMHLYAPVCDIATDMIEETLEANGQSTQQLLVHNIGPGRLEYVAKCQMFDGIRVAAKPEPRLEIGMRAADGDKSDLIESYFAPVNRNSGGPDDFGYSWIDSDEPGGPTFSWVDISTVGTAVTLSDDDNGGPYDIGFSFPFYDFVYDQLFIGSNGILTFGTGSSARTNTGFPNTTDPDNVIALWWDDLDPAEYGGIYYYYDAANTRFIVSFVGVPNYYSPNGTGSLSFQAILYPNGQIILQYETMDPGSDSDGLTGATIGIENVDGSDGLEVAYNAAYVHDNLAVSLKAARWMSVAPGGGSIDPFGCDTLTITFDAADMENGVYSGQIAFTTNDESNPSVNVPVSLNVSAYTCGDANGDTMVNVGDVVYVVNFVFKSGPAPDPLAAGDANNDGDVNVGDAVYVINYAFNSGPPPVCQ